MVDLYLSTSYLWGMLINELSKKTGVTPFTIRYYEKCGLIKGQRSATERSNNYFHYDEETVEKLEIIRDAKAIGFTLAEIGTLIDAWYSNRLSIPKKLSILDEKLVAIDEKIRQLKGMKKQIAEFKRLIEKDEC